jgi:hypothetical protein
MRNDEPANVINALWPVRIDELADAAYERRPDVALVRARAGTSTAYPRPHRERRPARRLAFVTGAIAAVTGTAVLATVALSGGGQGARDGGAARHGSTPSGAALDTRAFLLASADTLAKQPATHGTCWYSRTRMWQDQLPPKPGPGAPKPERKGPAFAVSTASSAEDWKCTLPGGTGMRFRTHLPLDIKVGFPTAKDRAAWRAAGSPPLPVNGGDTATKPFTTTYDRGSHLVNPDIGSHEIEWRTIAKLPATKNGLEKYLRRLWREDRKGGAHGYVAGPDFGEYVFVSAWDLFMAPATPGTRAALYRVLADSPSVHVTGRITDREGRSGVAITAHGTDVRLVVDPVTAQLLDFIDGGAGEYLAFERQGWVNRIGALPHS